MRIFGIKISFKRERPWVPREEFDQLSLAVLSLSDDIKSNSNGVEAGRKRLERHIGKDNGAVTPEEPVKPKQEAFRPNPGDVLSAEQIALIEGGK